MLKNLEPICFHFPPGFLLRDFSLVLVFSVRPEEFIRLFWLTAFLLTVTWLVRYSDGFILSVLAVRSVLSSVFKDLRLVEESCDTGCTEFLHWCDISFTRSDGIPKTLICVCSVLIWFFSSPILHCVKSPRPLPYFVSVWIALGILERLLSSTIQIYFPNNLKKVLDFKIL